MATLPEQIAAAIAQVPTEAARDRMQSESAILQDRLKLAATPAEKAEIEARLTQLRRDAEIAAQVSLWSNFSRYLVGGIVAAYFLGIWLYLFGLGRPDYAGLNATRAVLVFTLSIAMLGFGGLLMVRSLYGTGTAEELRERFRNAREVFFAFSGIFGTVIGFYFGTAGSGSPADPPSVMVGVSGDAVTATVARGRAPFTGQVTLDGGEVLTLGPTAVANQFSVRLNHRTQCPAKAVVRITDSDARVAEARIEQDAATLNAQGWAGCVPPGTGGSNSLGNATGNSAS